MAKKAKTGRPPIPDAKRQKHLIALRLTEAEYKQVDQAATKAGLSLSEYVRQQLGVRGDN